MGSPSVNKGQYPATDDPRLAPSLHNPPSLLEGDGALATPSRADFELLQIELKLTQFKLQVSELEKARNALRAPKDGIGSAASEFVKQMEKLNEWTAEMERIGRSSAGFEGFTPAFPSALPPYTRRSDLLRSMCRFDATIRQAGVTKAQHSPAGNYSQQTLRQGQLYARQGNFRDLPPYSGIPEKWTTFESNLERNTARYFDPKNGIGSAASGIVRQMEKPNVWTAETERIGRSSAGFEVLTPAFPSALPPFTRRGDPLHSTGRFAASIPQAGLINKQHPLARDYTISTLNQSQSARQGNLRDLPPFSGRPEKRTTFVPNLERTTTMYRDVAGKPPGANKPYSVAVDVNQNQLTGGPVPNDQGLLGEETFTQMSVASDEVHAHDGYTARGERRQSDDTHKFYLSDDIQRHKVPLPELSDTTGSGSGTEDDDLGPLKSNATDGIREEDWLFRKRLLKTTESSIAAKNSGMLVPSRTEEAKVPIDDRNADEIGDLSEAGSDCEEYESDGVAIGGEDSLSTPAEGLQEAVRASSSKDFIEGISSSTKTHDSLGENLAPDSLVSFNSLPVNEEPLLETSRCFERPEFLRQPETEWSHSEALPEGTLEEIRKSLHHHVGSKKPWIMIDPFTSWRHLLRTVAYVLRYNTFISSRERSILQNALTLSKLAWPEREIFVLAQRDSFQEGINRLQNADDVNHPWMPKTAKTSPIYKSCPGLNEHGVLRARGRLDSCLWLNEETRRPIIFPRGHYVTRLLQKHHHLRFRHVNHQTVVNVLRFRFYIPRLMTEYNQVRRSCQHSKNRDACPKPLWMVNLSLERLVVHQRPFSYTGGYYVGQAEAVRRRSEKQWGIQFTCLIKGAVHLEVAYTLNTSSCIMAVRRFIARRGRLIEIMSDRGTNFVSAVTELKQAWALVDEDKLAEEFTDSDRMWKFNPPGAPYFGECWERLAQFVKKVLREIKVCWLPTDEVLLSTFAEIKMIFNSRPLSNVSLDNDLEPALTPNHSLLRSTDTEHSVDEYDDDPTTLKVAWKTSQALAKLFWMKWVAEYLPTLTRREKWVDLCKPIAVRDIFCDREC